MPLSKIKLEFAKCFTHFIICISDEKAYIVRLFFFFYEEGISKGVLGHLNVQHHM